MLAPVRWFVLCCAALAAFTACASSDLSVGTHFDPLEQFPKQATWRWEELRNLLPTDERLVALDLGTAVKQAVAAELAERGYREAGSSVADYLLSFQLNVTPQMRVERSFAVGSLSLLLQDPDSKRRVWVGFAQTEVDLSRTASERGTRLRDTVRQMLLNFPPQPER